jgi:4-amino-4-deoxy-L-arabinose transferase-like glycosyltransferase
LTAKRTAWILALAVLVSLAPFVTKPVHVDDPLFIWAARHIQSHPGNPYDLAVNWYGFEQQMWETTKNPPLASYYLAATAALLGWSEAALHFAFFLPAVAAILGAHRLARRFCQRPMLAAILTLFTPVFLVSSTTIMCDVMMLAFWVWALVLWIEGSEHEHPPRLAAAAGLMALAGLTKYFGLCVVPLAVAWSIASKRPVRQWIGWLLVPTVAMVGYQLATRALYGRGLLADAATYATAMNQFSGTMKLQALLIALSFTGGCLAVAVFFLPLLWRPRDLAIGGAISVLVVGALYYVARSSFAVDSPAGVAFQITLWACGGIGLLVLAVADLCQRRDAGSWLLVLWFAGTFLFAALLNWTVNGRSLLPMAIPAAILIVRRLDLRGAKNVSRAAIVAPVVAGVALALWVTTADYLVAIASQQAARTIHASYGQGGQRLWFQGHWGFQYYMEAAGASAVDLKQPRLEPGDRVAFPVGEVNVYPPNEDVFVELETLSVPVPGYLTTISDEAGAGFYSSVWGPLPFAFGLSPPEVIAVYAYDPTGELRRKGLGKAR